MMNAASMLEQGLVPWPEGLEALSNPNSNSNPNPNPNWKALSGPPDSLRERLYSMAGAQGHAEVST